MEKACKQRKAEPVSAFYEQGRVHHYGTFPKLEDQMCLIPGNQKSPDRIDALVCALSMLILTAYTGQHAYFFVKSQISKSY
ncbi:hypothetical protein [Methanosarcina sp. UBA289]|uniref:hypothetical protein n=1 Tax=Methanosarcina sp. UBA289 TaxID=1915574 RepID=UPI0025F90516|nr:hypothetical protein [Methanosarcina sp. UBA289]